jgi:hypothetical protein
VRLELERIAQAFHEAYERLAPLYDYRTREASAKPWDEVPEGNRLLMVATVAELIRTGVVQVPQRPSDPVSAMACNRCGGIGRIEGPAHLDYADIWDCPDCDGTGGLPVEPAEGEIP